MCVRSTAITQQPRFRIVIKVLSIGVDTTFRESSFVSLAQGPWLFLLSSHHKAISAGANQKSCCK